MQLNKCKILYLALEMEMGGLQRVVNLLIRNINKDKFMPYLCCLDRGGLFYDQLDANLVSKFILGRRPGIFDIKMFGMLVRIIKDNKIDIIHSQNGCSAYSALAGRLTGVKAVIHTDHGRLIPDKKTSIWEDRLSSYMMDRVISVSEPLSNYLVSSVKVNNKKITTIINGVDTDKFAPLKERDKRVRRRELGLQEEANIIGTVCRLDAIKNLNLLIGSVPAILQNDPDCQFVIIGDGPQEKWLKEQSLKLKQSEKVVFMGRVAEVNRVLPVFDMYVNTSLSEGTSMTILEAMSCGLPIIASAVGGNINLVNESNGMLFNLKDAEKFVDAIGAILEKAELRCEMGANSRKMVEMKFSVDRMIDKYEQLYDSLRR
jgi:glycosyltransferase involved in cell wall biosynthesis